MQRQTVVDGGVILLVSDILSDNPFVGGVGTIEAMPVGRSRHRTGQVVQEQEIFTYLTNFLRLIDVSIAKLVLRGVGAGFDKVVAIIVQAEDSLAIPIHDGFCHGIQRLKTDSRELEHRDGHMQNFRLWHFEELVSIQSFDHWRQPVAHCVRVHFEHLIRDVIKVKNVEALPEHVILHCFGSVISRVEISLIMAEQRLVSSSGNFLRSSFVTGGRICWLAEYRT